MTLTLQSKKNKTLKNVLLKKKDKRQREFGRAIAAVVFLIFNIYTVFDESKTNMREFLIRNTDNKLNDDEFLNWLKVKT